MNLLRADEAFEAAFGGVGVHSPSIHCVVIDPILLKMAITFLVGFPDHVE